jgi:hypothetical protein
MATVFDSYWPAIHVHRKQNNTMTSKLSGAQNE